MKEPFNSEVTTGLYYSTDLYCSYVKSYVIELIKSAFVMIYLANS